ncbi:YqcI/YcgG family protein [Aquibacillus sediminis]|uniref:YqcI/YcgG family protein n=1 Tax=Aquibacillus sediminis TaxID=2574734 RepID=UPI001FE488F1|nr:YqcI/YcgG family protein [Aquibacillus sediminis]
MVPNHGQKESKRVLENRLKNYDSIGAHPDLNSYGEADNYEWRQYFCETMIQP